MPAAGAHIRTERRRGTKLCVSHSSWGKDCVFQQETHGILKEIIEGNIAKGLFTEAWARLRVPTKDTEASRNSIEGSSREDQGRELLPELSESSSQGRNAAKQDCGRGKKPVLKLALTAPRGRGGCGGR